MFVLCRGCGNVVFGVFLGMFVVRVFLFFLGWGRGWLGVDGEWVGIKGVSLDYVYDL